MQGTSHINQKKSLLKKKILNNAFETIVANANHNYVLDPMNKFVTFFGKTYTNDISLSLEN